jgi:signal peptidase
MPAVRRASVVVSTLIVLLLVPPAVALVGAWTNGWTLASVTTGSMRPGTPPGSAVVLAPTSPAEVGVGDVIGYRDERVGAVVTHRVVQVLEQPSGRFFITQGDANPRPDGRPVAARDVVGEVRWRIAGLGALVEAGGERSVQAALAGVPLALLLASEVAGWRGRRLGRVIAALRAEVDRLRAAAEVAPGERSGAAFAGPPLTPVPRLPSRPGAPRPVRATDGSACVAGLA